MAGGGGGGGGGGSPLNYGMYAQSELLNNLISLTKLHTALLYRADALSNLYN